MAGQSVALLTGDEEAARLESLLGPEKVEICRLALPDLVQAIKDGPISAAILAHEALSEEDVGLLRRTLRDQPEWYDFPIVLLADRSMLDDSPVLREIEQLRLVERPIIPAVLMTVLRSAFRSRSLQVQALAYSYEVVAAEEHYRRLTESLEANVAGQIADLKALSDRLAEQVEVRKRAEQRTRESEQLYRYTVELSEQMVWTADADGRIMAVGPRFALITGLTETFPLNPKVASVIHPDDLEQVRSSWKRAVCDGAQHRVEFRMRVADGNYRAFVSRAAPLRDEEGKIVRWYGYTEDIHDRREAMAALRQAEERYRLASRATNDAIWDWNVVTGQIDWSEAAAVFLGREPVEGSSVEWWEQAIHPEDRERVVNSINATIESDRVRWSAAYRMRKADGDYAYVYDRGFFIRDEDGKVVRGVGAVVDLTERRRAESELRRTQAELIHVSRVSAMGTMASTLAHELNQPLTAVTSYIRGSRRLLANSKDPNVQQVCDALEHAEGGALRAGQIVRRLRELVARGNVVVGPEDLQKLVEDASLLALIDEHLHGISHHIEIDPRARWAEADRIQIQQVLINLIRNAVQAMQNSERREIVISTRPSGDLIEVSVADSGAGISESVRGALFSPFHSTKSEGLGIGLSISRTIVEAHHGRIWAEDADGGGAIFRFTLPRADVPVLDVPQQNGGTIAPGTEAEASIPRKRRQKAV